MATLDDLDTALANAKTARAALRAPLNTAKTAWTSALTQLNLMEHRPVRPGPGHTPAPSAPSTPVTTSQLQGLADAYLAALTAFNTADAAVATAQTAYNAASKSAKVS